MTKDEAIGLIEKTFKNPFNEDRFRLFARNLLNGLDESKEVVFDYYGQYIRDAYKDHVKRYKRIGKYIDTEKSELDVLIVNLAKETALGQARTMQRNFIAWYLKNRGAKDAALVAFHTDGLEDWRFSFVRMDYRRVEKKGKLKLQEDLTPARRYSFLVGKNEPNHTARQQLLPIMQEDKQNPSLFEIESAFNIESVTKEFFEKYKGLFLKVEEELEGLVKADNKIKRDFELKKIAVADFAKKLLGQIVFLYFLQKKGWLGVEKDEAGNFKGWGTGPKNFLRQLFDKKIAPYENFFNNLLEPLFYEALAIDRGAASFYSPFKCKIPFLNGGLFEPIGGYNWQETDILLKNEIFAEIFNTFDLFNFTVREDEPLEKEVAVDPEMLGKVFENLLEVKDRKSKGAFYTPREIVHYMCQESLINYLDASVNIKQTDITTKKPVQKKLIGEPDPEQLGFTAETYNCVIPRKDIESFIRMGEFCIENDIAKESGTTSYNHKLPKAIRTNAGLLDGLLTDIRICDPAIGSGAFPVGMLHEIVTARRVLTAYIGESTERTRYDFKRHAIQECIYGVDIDVSAVDIAKLRLWLSLVVDEDDFETIKPLPNLDYKIVSGNSLLGVKKDLLNDHLFKELEALKQQFFDETNPRKKKEEKEKIDKLISQLTHDDEHFDFEIYFSEVFHQKSGFDIVIANPPYVRHESIKDQKPQLKTAFPDFYCGTADLYTYFYRKGLDILKSGGHLCFIAPNKFMRAGYGEKTRRLLTAEALLKVIIDFGDLPIFDATTYPSILLLKKAMPSGKDKALTAVFTEASQLARLEETLANKGFIMPVSSLRAEGWNLEQPDVLALMEKLRKAGTPLGEYVEGKIYYGIKTGLNDAFVIDGPTRERLIAEDPKSGELIKPWLRGRDIRRWKTEWAGLYVIAIPSSANRQWPWSAESNEKKARPIFEKIYPSIHRHLSQWEDKLQERDDKGKFWWELRSCAYYEEFERPKIVYADIAQSAKFTWDESRVFLGNTAYIIPTDEKWLVGLLNSKLIWWFYVNLSSIIRGGFVRFIAQYMEQLPIFSASAPQKAPIIERVNKILANPDSPGVPALEAEIDRLVYTLYGLTDEEIAIIETGHS